MYVSLMYIFISELNNNKGIGGDGGGGDCSRIHYALAFTLLYCFTSLHIILIIRVFLGPKDFLDQWEQLGFLVNRCVNCTVRNSLVVTPFYHRDYLGLVGHLEIKEAKAMPGIQ